MSHPDSCAPASVRDEIAIAYAALRDGDLGHAAHHVAGALAADPLDVEATAVFDALVEAADDPLSLAPIAPSGPTWFGTVAMRGRILAKLGRVSEGVDRIVRAVGAAPDTPYLAWLDTILPKGALEAAVCESLGRALSSISLEFGAKLPDGSALRPNAETATRFLALVTERLPNDATSQFAYVRFLRATGRTKQAVDRARSFDARSPTYMSAAVLGASLRDDDRVEEATHAFRDAVARAHAAHDLGSVAASNLDLGDTLVDLRRFGEASAAYRAALDANPTETWAIARLPYAVYSATGDEGAYATLRAIAFGPTTTRDARACFRRVAKDVEDFVEPPRDALANLVRQLGPSEMAGRIASSTSAPEGGSNVAALRLKARAHGVATSVEISFPPATPGDGREPMPGESLALFLYDGTTFHPAYPPASDDVEQRIVAIVMSLYSLDVWTESATALGRELGSARYHELLGVMANPPLPPSTTVDFPDWVLHVQIAAALALLGVDEGGTSDFARRTLFAFCRGPVDWPVTAAIHALVALVRRSPSLRAEVLRMFDELEARRLSLGACTYDVALGAARRLLESAPPSR